MPFLPNILEDIMEALFHLLMVMEIFHGQIAAEILCDDNIFLRFGHQDIVSCDFGDFDIVGWLHPTQDLQTAVPFISLEGSEIHRPESLNEEYDILPNGSLVISNVTYSHEKNYSARLVNNGAVSHLGVQVKVYVLPVPAYPVVNGNIDRDRAIVISSSSKSSFSCTMEHVRPAVPLEVVFVSPVSDYISMKTNPTTLNNTDGTFTVSLDTRLNIGIDLPIGIYSLQCAVAKTFEHLFTSVATIELVVLGGQKKFPSVNELDNQQHVVLDVTREGTLTCSMDGVSSNVELDWNYINRDSSRSIELQGQRHSSVVNEDGTYNITSITTYEAIDDSIQSVILKCRLLCNAADLYPLYTTVELNFPTVDGQYKFPSVNDLDNQQHIVLDVKREATLSCAMDRVLPNLYLEWKHIHHVSSSRIILERHRHYSSDNGDGTYNLTSTVHYKVTNQSIQCVTVKCMVSGKAAHLYPLYTTVELNFPAVDPVNCSSTFCFSLGLVLLVAFVAVVVGVVISAITKYTVRRRRMKRKLQRVRRRRMKRKLQREVNLFPVSLTR